MPMVASGSLDAIAFPSTLSDPGRKRNKTGRNAVTLTAFAAEGSRFVVQSLSIDQAFVLAFTVPSWTLKENPESE
jgi:hypothetical protein